jgi:4-amino-4-deoxy-L-arabinose transferase-like glycosyltransferase
MQPLNRSALLSDIGMTPALNHAPPANSTRFRMPMTWNAVFIFGAALAFFALGLHAKFFEDEYAYINQSYYADLFFSGQWNHRLWLQKEAVDLQPLPKYLIGLAFRLVHLPMPGLRHARNWYDDYRAFGTASTLVAARLPVIPLGALGCLGLFAAGVIARNARLGTIAAVLLMLNPLYALHSHRAMSDVPCDAFMVSSLAVWLYLWARVWSRGSDVAVWVLPCLAGLLSGMALLCKLNGFIGLGIIAVWTVATWLAPRLSTRRKLLLSIAAAITISVALGTAVALNPFLTARPAGRLVGDARILRLVGPWERFRYQIAFRQVVSNNQKTNFPHNALRDPLERAKVVLVQGFGRFGPFGPRGSDSTERYDLRQDWGAILWLPLVLLGLFQAVRLGLEQLREGRPPFALAIVLWAACAWTVVTLYLPMAWDRYQIPIESGNALLGALASTFLWERLALAAKSRAKLERT